MLSKASKPERGVIMDNEQYKPDEIEESAVGEAVRSESYVRKDDQRYTYSDYLEWDDDQRWELVDGVPFLMSAPSTRHQELCSNLHGQLFNLLKGKQCKVFFAPFDVRLNADTFDNTVVQPDIIVICDRAKLDKAGCKGAPDFVIEILSPSTSSRDRHLKFDLYRKVGVREYWVIEPDENILSAHILSNEDYITRIYGETDTAPISVLDNCMIDLSEVFPQL